MNYPTVLSTPEIERFFPGVSALPTTFVLDRDGSSRRSTSASWTRRAPSSRRWPSPAPLPSIVVTDAEDEDKARQEEAKARVQNAAQANKIPGVNLAALSPEARAKVLQQLNSEHCTCGCGLTLAQCRIDDPTCSVSLPLAQALVKKIADAGK